MHGHSSLNDSETEQQEEDFLLKLLCITGTNPAGLEQWDSGIGNCNKNTELDLTELVYAEYQSIQISLLNKPVHQIIFNLLFLT